jgi:uncharacterized protein (DUF1697 family)
MTWVAFLRAINVGGRGIVKMTDVKQAFERAACGNVSTIIASGNVLFDGPARLGVVQRGRIGRCLAPLFGAEPVVVYRPMTALERLVQAQPFGRLASDPAVKLSVLFVDEKTKRRITFPVTLPKERLEAVRMEDTGDVLVVSRRKPNGWYGFPTLWIEKELDVVATARNWTTVRRIVERGVYSPRSHRRTA